MITVYHNRGTCLAAIRSTHTQLQLQDQRTKRDDVDKKKEQPEDEHDGGSVEALASAPHLHHQRQHLLTRLRFSMGIDMQQVCKRSL